MLARLRTAAGIVLTWGVVWVVLAIVIVSVIGVADPDSIDEGEGPLDAARIIGGMGLLCGAIFAAMLALVERRRTVAEVPPWRAAVWGVLAGIAPPLLSPMNDAIATTSGPLGLLAALVTVAVARAGVGLIAGAALFFAGAPGVIAGWVPYRMTRWRMDDPLVGAPFERTIGGVLMAIGVAALAECFARFAFEGRGTPAPIAPTERLVVSGLYRFVRNPMYVSVVTVVLGQALLLGSAPLLAYAGVVWLASHLFVLLYEEPTLRRTYGEAYERYCANVARWRPRLTPWRDSGAPS
ncbi:MAG: isoprenylcysteine carboxylmethyltransferase family protein [Acidobacteriota bacterium]